MLLPSQELFLSRCCLPEEPCINKSRIKCKSVLNVYLPYVKLLLDREPAKSITRNLGKLSIWCVWQGCCCHASLSKISLVNTQDRQLNTRLAKLRDPISFPPFLLGEPSQMEHPPGRIMDVISTWFLKEVAGTVPTAIPPVINHFKFWFSQLLILNMQQSKAHWRTPN